MSSLKQFSRSAAASNSGTRSPATTARTTSPGNNNNTTTSSVRLPNIASPSSSNNNNNKNTRSVSPQNNNNNNNTSLSRRSPTTTAAATARTRSPGQSVTMAASTSSNAGVMSTRNGNNANKANSMMASRRSPSPRGANTNMTSSTSGRGGASGIGGAGSLRGGADSRMKQEALMKKSQKKMRDLLKLEMKLRADADQERAEFVEQMSKQFDSERESVIFKTINRLNGEVSTLKRTLQSTEQAWRLRWKKVVGDELGKFTDMLITENLIDAESVPPGSMSALAFANDANATNFDEVAAKLSAFTKDSHERAQTLKRDVLNQQLRGDDLQGSLENRTAELAAADRLIRTHLVGRGSEHTIAVELFRKQGSEFEKRFENLEKEFRSRVEELLRDSASIEMVGSHNAEDALMARVKENRALLYNNNNTATDSTGASSSSTSTSTTRLTMTEENAKRVESAKNWRPSGKNYVDILETFITSMECQKILQVQLLREVQLAMIDLSKKHFQNITSEIRKNRSNLPASVRNKLFEEKSVTRDDLIEMLDILSFEPRVAEMIMGRFPPTELTDAAPELERFVESHGGIYDQQLQQQQQQTKRGLVSSSSSSPPSIAATKLSNMSVDGGDSRSAGVDLGDVERERFLRRTLATTNVQPNHFIGSPNLRAFGNANYSQQQLANASNPKRVQLPRKPFEVYSSKLVYSTKTGFSEVGSGEGCASNSGGSPPVVNARGELM